MINESNQLTIPLYHATSNFFLDSIRRYGLGGRRDVNIFNENIFSLLIEALNQPENKTMWWDINGCLFNNINDQKVTRGGFNFRYGNAYLTPSLFTAKSYATSSRLGSEYLSSMHDCFNALFEVSPSVAKEIIPTDHPINEIFNTEHIPILITARNVNVSNLKTEQGDAIDHQLKWMSEEKKESPNVDPEGLWQQCNFELIGAIPLDQLKFSTLDGNEIIF
jgi:hypothetical protein